MLTPALRHSCDGLVTNSDFWHLQFGSKEMHHEVAFVIMKCITKKLCISFENHIHRNQSNTRVSPRPMTSPRLLRKSCWANGREIKRDRAYRSHSCSLLSVVSPSSRLSNRKKVTVACCIIIVWSFGRTGSAFSAADLSSGKPNLVAGMLLCRPLVQQLLTAGGISLMKRFGADNSFRDLRAIACGYVRNIALEGDLISLAKCVGNHRFYDSTLLFSIIV